MTIMLAGGSGLIGSELGAFLTQTGHRVLRLVRENTIGRNGGVLWNPAEHRLEVADFEGVDAVVCLSGENIAKGRWTVDRKRSLRESRIQTAALLSRTLAAMDSPPETLICASAIGYYGAHCGSEVLTEESPVGDDFLANLCADWEAAARPAVEKGIRVVHLRFGIVLSRRGGALGKMLIPFRLGLGGVLGDGSQYMSWLSLDEAVSILDFVLQTDQLEGPVNAMSPNPVTNREFTRTLAKVLGRPALLTVPKPAVRLLFGEMGESLLLGSQRAVPMRLEAAGYTFRHSELEPALRHILVGKSA